MLTPLPAIERLRDLREHHPDKQDYLEHLRDKALLASATELAITSAFNYGVDLPVGAVAAVGDWINGRYFASDRRAGYSQMHAEYMAIHDASLNTAFSVPDTIVVTVEPCDFCQDFLKTVSGLKRVGFALTRSEVAERGLVKPHEETIFERARRLNMPYEVVQIQDPFCQNVGRTILDNVRRDAHTEAVEVNTTQLALDLQALELA